MSSNSVDDCLSFFQKAKPDPTVKDIHTQLGVHFEEVNEMIIELSPLTDDAAALLTAAGEAVHALAEHLKATDLAIRVTDDCRIGMVDALSDQLVTAIGSAHVLNMDIAGAFNEVNESNFSKFDEHGEPIFHPNGKIAKGPNYREPDLSPFV